jgi:hypothetical protein
MPVRTVTAGTEQFQLQKVRTLMSWYENVLFLGNDSHSLSLNMEALGDMMVHCSTRTSTYWYILVRHRIGPYWYAQVQT